MLDRLHAERGRDMGLSGARTTDQNDVLRPVHELAAIELAHRGFIHLAA